MTLFHRLFRAGLVLELVISSIVPLVQPQVQFPGTATPYNYNSLFSPYGQQQYYQSGGSGFPYPTRGSYPYQQQTLPGLSDLNQPLPNPLFQQETLPYERNPRFQSYPNPELNGNALSPQYPNQLPYHLQHHLPSLPSLGSVPAQFPQRIPSSETVRGGFSVRNGSYILEWEVNSPMVTFRARRRGIGFVGFAISPSGGMSGADIFIAGIGPTGMHFANDYHHEYLPGGIGSAVIDASNDYQLLDITESQGYTSARFQRLLNTQDTRDDQAIENIEQNILWSIGPPSRELEYHGPDNRGVIRINLLNPPAKFRLQRPLS